MLRPASVFLFICVCVGASLAQSAGCPSGSSVVVRGFKLGMTESDVLRRYPKIEIYDQKTGNGVTTSSSGQSPALDAVFSEEVRKGIGTIDLVFLDKKLAKIEVAYDGFTEWVSMTEFVNAIAGPLKLPEAVSWKAEDKRTLKLSCSDFEATIIWEQKRSQYEVQKQVLILSIAKFKDVVDSREKNKNESQKKVFKP
jgi:hypothetical protein